MHQPPVDGKSRHDRIGIIRARAVRGAVVGASRRLYGVDQSAEPWRAWCTISTRRRLRLGDDCANSSAHPARFGVSGRAPCAGGGGCIAGTSPCGSWQSASPALMGSTTSSGADPDPPRHCHPCSRLLTHAVLDGISRLGWPLQPSIRGDARIGSPGEHAETNYECHGQPDREGVPHLHSKHGNCEHDKHAD